MKKLFYTLVSLSIIIIYGISEAEDLGLKINAPIDKKLAGFWIKSMQDAYSKFLVFFLELANNSAGLRFRTIKEFQLVTTECFDLMRGKAYNRTEELDVTVRRIFLALSKSIRWGVRAAVDLSTGKQNRLYNKLLIVLDKLGSALLATVTFDPQEFVAQRVKNISKDEGVYDFF